MTDNIYDTRPRQDILAAPHFRAYHHNPGLAEVGLRELRTLDRFFRHAERKGISVPGVDDFLAFVANDRSPRKLDDLRTAFDRLLPKDTPVRQTIRDAIRQKRPRTRTCDWRSKAELREDPLMAPYRALPAFEHVPVEDLRVLARFLTFAEARAITVPTEADYLEFTADTQSSRRLRSLKSALDRLLPGSPAVHLVLANAIRRHGPKRKTKAGTKPRRAAARRVPLADLPPAWQALLRDMRLGAMPIHQAVPALSVVDSMTDVLREYAKVQKDTGMPCEISVEGVRRFKASRAAHAALCKTPKYQHQGNRPATRHTAVMRLKQFGQALGIDPLVLQALEIHENRLRRNLKTVVPLKFGKLDTLPGLSKTWSLAAFLLAQSAAAPRHQTRLRLLNEAAIVALWTLLPLRLEDGQLVWGRDIRFVGSHYRVDIDTHKEGEPLRGALAPVLTPFFDVLVLRGLDPAHLDEMRRRAIAEELPLFRAIDGRKLARSYPSKVWRAHFGTGAHISRTRVHTELGQLGPEGVEAALALNAQRDPRTAALYQAKAVEIALRQQGQDMVDGLLSEVCGK